MIANHPAIAKKTRWQNDAFHMRGPAISPTKGALILIVMIAVVVVSGAVAWDGDVPGWELSILEFFNGWLDWLEPIMWVLQQPGVLLAPLIAGAIIAGLIRRWHCSMPSKWTPTSASRSPNSLTKTCENNRTELPANCQPMPWF